MSVCWCCYIKFTSKCVLFKGYTFRLKKLIEWFIYTRCVWGVVVVVSQKSTSMKLLWVFCVLAAELRPRIGQEETTLLPESLGSHGAQPLCSSIHQGLAWRFPHLCLWVLTLLLCSYLKLKHSILASSYH